MLRSLVGSEMCIRDSLLYLYSFPYESCVQHSLVLVSKFIVSESCSVRDSTLHALSHFSSSIVIPRVLLPGLLHLILQFCAILCTSLPLSSPAVLILAQKPVLTASGHNSRWCICHKWSPHLQYSACILYISGLYLNIPATRCRLSSKCICISKQIAQIRSKMVLHPVLSVILMLVASSMGYESVSYTHLTLPTNREV